jgi:hypothetical protein
MDGFEKIGIEMALEAALTRRHQQYMYPLFEGFELNQSDVDFVLNNSTSNSAESMALTLRWIAGRMNASYRREFMGEITAMRKAVDEANAAASAAEKSADRTAKKARIDIWITFIATGILSLAALVISVLKP